MKSYNLLLFVLVFISLNTLSQQEIQINGISLSKLTCAEIKTITPIPEVINGYYCEIKDAQINKKCLQLTIVYGGCNGNIELLTDGKINKNGELYFNLRWINPSFCKAYNLIKLNFDLSPFTSLILEKNASIKITNTPFELFYSN